MEESRVRTVPAPAALLLAVLLACGCAGRHAGPRTLAVIGGLAIAGGSAAWAAGEGFGPNDSSSSSLSLAGFATVGAGLLAVVAAGGWIAVAVSCDADPDCDEDEQCREIPAPPGGVPYKQCMSR